MFADAGSAFVGLSGGSETRTIPLCLEAERTFGAGSNAFEDAGFEVETITSRWACAIERS